MKKLFLMLAVAASAMTASAQEPKSGFADAKFWDNWYLGANLGVMSKATDQAVLKNMNPEFGIRFGKWFTPSVGLSAEGAFLFGNKTKGYQLTDPSLFHAMKFHLLGTLNFSNAFGGYTGSPRSFEVIGLAGIGLIHNFGTKKEQFNDTRIQLNMLSSKLGLDFAWNFGSEKEWQFYVEPALTYALGGAKNGQKIQYNSNYANLELNVGINYYFKTSNGTHHFLNITECDQREIDALNNTINDLRNKNAADQAKIAQLQAEIARLTKALRDCENKPAPEAPFEAPTIPSVFYNVNKSLITKQQAENVAVAAQILKNHPELKLNIKGYASPEGKAKKNQELSVRRANAVKDLLVKKYGIDESRITAEGCGTTKDKYETYENNRVAMLFFEK